MPAPEPVRASSRLTVMRLLRLALALTAAVSTALGILMVGAPAQALSCIGPEAVAAGAATVFTGTIVDTQDKRLLVEVQEIWHGDPITSRVWLDTDPTLDGWWDTLPGRTVPDHYASPGRWLFMPRDDTGTLQVSPCSAWPLTGTWRVDYPRPTKVSSPLLEDQIVTSSAVEPAGQAADAGHHGLVVSGAAAAAGIVGGLAYLVVRRRTQSSG